MKNRRLKSKFLGALTCIVIVILTATCAPAKAPTTTQPPAPKKEIVIGQLMDYSAFYKEQGACFKAAADAFERYINEEKGGVDGHKVKFVHYDFKAQPAVAVAAVKQGNMQDHPIVWVSAYSSAINAVKEQVATDKVLMLGLPNAQGLSTPEGFVLITRPLYEETMVGTLTWFKNSWKQPRKIRYGILAAEGFPSALAFVKSADKIAAMTGVEIAFVEWLPAMLTDASPFMAKVEAAMPIDLVTVGHVDAPVALLLRALKERGLTAKLTPMITTNAGPNNVRKLAGHAIEGLLVVCPYASYTEANQIPLMATVCRLCKEYTPEFYPPDLLYLQAWVNYLCITEGLAKAARKVGWDKVTSADLRDVLISGVKIDTGGLSKPVYWEGPMYHRGLHWDKVTKQTATGEDVISDWIKIPNWYEEIEGK